MRRPLLPTHAAPPVPAKTLNPVVLIDGVEYGLMTQNLATVPLSRLRAPVGPLAAHRDEIVRAIDALLSGFELRSPAPSRPGRGAAFE
jgi:toxin CcdB